MANPRNRRIMNKPTATTVTEAVAMARSGRPAKLFSKTLNAEIWIVANGFMAAKLALAKRYDGDPIYTVAEIQACRGFTHEEMKELHELKAAFGGLIHSLAQPVRYKQ